MSLLEKYAAKKKEEFMSNVSDEIKALVKSGKVIELSEFSGMRMNSYERRLLTPLLSGELLRQQIEYCLGQEPGGGETHKYALPSGYHNAILGEFLPELLRRLKWKSPEENPPPAGLKVLATYLNRLGNRRTVMAMRVPAKFEECNCDDRGCEHDCDCEHDENRDRNYVRAGWYEVVENFDEFDFVPLDGVVDGWRFIPAFSESFDGWRFIPAFSESFDDRGRL